MPASPIFDSEGNCHSSNMNNEYGLTKREYFAGLAMQGMSSHPDFYGNSETFSNDIARDCVKFADALLEELDK